jgi:hypothetical protein
MANFLKFLGLDVVDATEPLEVHVQKTDAKNAVKLQPGNCACAAAFKRELNMNVFVYRGVMFKLDRRRNVYVRYTTPKSAAEETARFDTRGEFTPGTYVFTPPKHYEKRTGKRQGGKTDNPKPKTKRSRRTFAFLRPTAKLERTRG